METEVRVNDKIIETFHASLLETFKNIIREQTEVETNESIFIPKTLNVKFDIIDDSVQIGIEVSVEEYTKNKSNDNTEILEESSNN